MAFLSDNLYNEEIGETIPMSMMLVELKSKDAFIRISVTPEKSKQQLIDIFNQFKF